MKRALKIIALGLVVVVCAVAVAAFLAIRNTEARMKVVRTVQPAGFELSSDPAVIAEGGRLYQTRGCADCHGANAAGRTFISDPGIGTYTGRNLTRGANGLTADFGPADFVRAVRHSLRKDGTPLIFMPSRDFERMADEDIAAIVSWINAQPGVDSEAIAQRPTPLAKVLSAAGQLPNLIEAEHIDHSAPAPSKPPVGETVEFGRYVATGCTGCHGQGLSGGRIPGTPPSIPIPGNLTPDQATGLGAWSEAEFFAALREGKKRDGTQINPFMPVAQFSKMNDTEIRAIWMYLQTLPPTPHGQR